MNPMIVGLGHRKRVGKDLFAEFLRDALAVRQIYTERTSFAYSLKSVCNQLYGWAGMRHAQYYEEHPEFRDIVLEAIGKTPRTIWIEVGNKLREVYPHTWIKSVVGDECYAEVLIVRDVRYPNEAEEIQKLGGLLIKVERPDVPNTDDVADCALEGFDGWDSVVVNDGSIGRFREKAAELVQTLIVPAMSLREPPVRMSER